MDTLAEGLPSSNMAINASQAKASAPSADAKADVLQLQTINNCIHLSHKIQASATTTHT